MIPTREAQRLRRLLQRRLKQFEAALRRMEQGEDAATPQPVQLEREAKALMALMKALQAAAEMEEQGAERQQQSSDAARAEDALRRRLAQQLEALCAPTGPPRRGGGTG